MPDKQTHTQRHRHTETDRHTHAQGRTSQRSGVGTCGSWIPCHVTLPRGVTRTGSPGFRAAGST
eukprot:2373564-Rhodomonas_salina.1